MIERLAWRGLALAIPALVLLGLTASNASAATDGFDYPFGNKDKYTQASDGDGWYSAQDHGDYYAGNGKYHLGEDWNLETGGNSDCGQNVYSVAEGTVVYSADGGSGWGNVIIIRHTFPSGTEVESLYAHLTTRHVTSGTVTKGQRIGTVGNANGAYFCHLHLEIRNSNCPNSLIKPPALPVRIH